MAEPWNILIAPPSMQWNSLVDADEPPAERGVEAALEAARDAAVEAMFSVARAAGPTPSGHSVAAYFSGHGPADWTGGRLGGYNAGATVRHGGGGLLAFVVPGRDDLLADFDEDDDNPRPADDEIETLIRGDASFLDALCTTMLAAATKAANEAYAADRAEYAALARDDEEGGLVA